ncbi:MAG: SOS response-associated peptidase, partial [Chloroflexota bacterium]
AFRSAFKRRRCLVPASGFYEWRAEPGKRGKTPMYITMQDGQPFAFAGLWEDWNAPDGSRILSCTIITTEPNPLMAETHNRMPVVLPPSAYAQWLTPGEVPPARLTGLLQPYPAEAMRAHPVSTLVNSPGNDAADCVRPLAD